MSCYSLTNQQLRVVCVYATIIMQNPIWYQVHVVVTLLFNFVIVISPLTTYVLSCMNNAVDLSWWFQVPCKNVVQVCSFKSVPTCMNKPVNNTVQAGQLNHVQACEQAKTSRGCGSVYVCVCTIFFYTDSHLHISEWHIVHNDNCK